MTAKQRTVMWVLGGLLVVSLFGIAITTAKLMGYDPTGTRHAAIVGAFLHRPQWRTDMIGTETWECAFEDCIRTLEDPRASSEQKGDVRLRLRKLGRNFDRLEQSGWDDLDGDVREDFFPNEE